MIKTIPTYKSYKYSEVWEITEWKDGCIYKTRNTRYCIEASLNKNPLNPDRYLLAPISTSQLKGDSLEIMVLSPDYFD